MPNEFRPEPDEQSAPNISADFLTGSTETGLDRIRTRLLDLTNRNKLLNFRHSNASSMRFVNAAIEPVFARLRDGEKLSFLAVPQPIVHFSVLSAKDYAEELGWNTSLDLVGTEGGEIAGLPVLQYEESLDTISRKISSAAKTAIEESGANVLYLVFGFLEWYESEDSQQPHLAPLVAVPVTIDRRGTKGKAVETVLEHSGEDIQTNLSLVEKMRRDFGLEIPLLEDENTPQDYFAKFAKILELKRRWKVRRHMTLAFLSFGKLLMYRDLDPKTWPVGESIAKHPLVRSLFEGLKQPNVSLAKEYPIDAPELKHEVPQLIRDADSSQHSALIDAVRGLSLVIEGPPGTGKSQTITNLIAAVLARGKTVLFVSEKLAALEVVRKRLDEAGLGIFCLEVHSHKTKKGALLGDLAQRYAMRGTFQDPRDLDRHLSLVEKKKQLLTQYASLINKIIVPFEASTFDVLWARDQSGEEIGHHRDRLGKLGLPVVIKYTQTDFIQTEQFLSVYSQHAAAVLASCDSIEQHPWSWITVPLGFAEEERFLNAMEEFRAASERAEDCCKRLESEAGLSVVLTIDGLLESVGMQASLPDVGTMLVENLLPSCQLASDRRRLESFVEQVETYRVGLASLESFTANAAAIISNDLEPALSAVLAAIDEKGLNGLTLAELRQLQKNVLGSVGIFVDAHSSIHHLLGIMACDAPATISSSIYLLELLRIVDTAPFGRLHLRQASFEAERIKPLLETAWQEAIAIKAEEEKLRQLSNLSSGSGQYTPTQLLQHATVLEESSLWQRLFGRPYDAAVQCYNQLSIDKHKASRHDMSQGLRSLGYYALRKANFEQHASYRDALGPHFNGLATPWAELNDLLLWYEQIFVTLPEHQPQAEPYRKLLFTARLERLRAIRASTVAAEAHRSNLDKAGSCGAELIRLLPAMRSVIVSGTFDDIKSSLAHLSTELREANDLITRWGIHDTVVIKDIPQCLAVARQCGEMQASIDSSSGVRGLLRDAFRGVETDLEAIKRTVEFAHAIASGRLPSKTVEWLLSNEYDDRLRELRALLSSAEKCGIALKNAADFLATSSGSPVWSSPSTSISGLRALVEHALAHLHDLAPWHHFKRVQVQSREDGLGRLTALADAKIIELEELVPAFRFVFYNTLARSIFTKNPDLAQVSGITQERLRQQFTSSDKEAIRLYSARVAAIIDKRTIPYGNQSGPVSTWTELALIINEINKQKRHIPIRKLIKRSANALVALKPCFMMGPLSVAQYLAPGQLKFDLVVMDEASQLKPEDALGAMARGGQVVIVGDPKQLPPTSFFQRVALDEEDESDSDERTAVEEGESILDVASTMFQPVRRLRWHYRSRHHSLIAFSNEEFYQRDLIIFPSAYHDDPSLGVKHHFVPNGVFEASRNPNEADIVVEAVLVHMRENPHESLGIVTLNAEQRELVEELLDRRLRDDPAAIAYQEKMKAGLDELFVKNLENVQGDERDVIFISTTYGPDARGNQYQRFGPINGPSGHRRLNVLFTRAKKRTVVFSSLDPDRIQTTASSPWGVRALKKYLLYARTGVLQQADDGNDQPTNDFERSIGSVLKDCGYQVVPQVGIAGFFIDLAVKHPAKPGAYLLGVECDGASYHSGRSARDRDRLRQEILENLGWKIHRIWSTDWFTSRDSEIKRLLKRIEDLLEDDPAYRKQQEVQIRRQSLRKRLIELRDTEIAVSFPSAFPETSLLGPVLLDEFLQKRPRTRDDWFRKISQSSRTRVDSKQVGRYLDRVLELISNCDG